MKLKIGITCYPTVGGSGVIATELGKMLAIKGHEIHFITSDIPARLDQLYSNIYYHEVEVNQYDVFRYPPYDLTLASRMAEIATREELDLLHVHYAVPHAISAYLAKQIVGGHLKIITTLHGTDITILGDDPTLAPLIRFGIHQSDRVTAVSHDLVQQTYDLIQPDKEIDTVYNFVNEEIYHKRDGKNLCKSFGIHPKDKVLVHTSNFRAVKRVPDVIKVFAKVHNEWPSKLMLIGEGPQLPQVRRQVIEYGLEKDVLFMGERNQVAEILSMCDLQLLLSEKESFGLVLLEAMACGVPVIGTNVGGIPEVIEDGKTGYICKVGDIDSIAQKALWLLRDQKLYEEMSMQAIRRVHTHFHSEQILEQYEKIYYETLGLSYKSLQTSCKGT